MRKNIKRVLSVLLSIMLIFSIIPTQVFAASTVSVYGDFFFNENETDVPAVGVTVTLRDENKNPVATTKTDENGHFVFDECTSNTEYYITTDGGPGYADDDDEDFINDGNAYWVVTTTAAENTFFKGGSKKYLSRTYGNVELTKYKDGTTTVVPDAVYELYTEDDSLIGEYATTSEGKISVNSLAYGNYYFKEKTAPTGFFISTDTVAFSIAQNGETVSVTAYDIPKCDITLTKRDADTNNLVPNAVYSLKDSSGTEIGEYTTDANGSIAITDLVPGTYKLVEKNAPSLYILDPTEHAVELTVAAPSAIIEATNTHYPEVTITKVNDRTNEFVAGASFDIVNTDTNTVVQTIASLDAPTSLYLAPGNYKLVEISAPAGYIKANDMPFTMTAGQTTTVEVREQEYTLTIYKFAENEFGTTEYNGRKYNEVSDVQFTVNGPDGYFETVNSAIGGTTLYAVPAGEYTITETIYPDSFIPEEITKTIVLSDTTTNAEVVFYNDLIEAEITIDKVSDTGKPLFATFNLSGNFDVDETFTAGSYTTTLKPGVYTLTEVEPPEGYASAANKTIEIDQYGNVYYEHELVTTPTIDVVNNPISLQINKLDSSTNNQIAGVKFRLEKDDGTYIYDFTTTNEPTIISEDLTPGDYTLTETEPAKGYAQAAPVSFTLADTDSVQVQTVYNDEIFGSLIINKYGASFDTVTTFERIAGFFENIFTEIIYGSPASSPDYAPLGGVEFTVYAAEDIYHPDGVTGIIYHKGDVVDVITTDISGYARLDNLYLGKYTYVETSAPSIYVRETFEHEVTVQNSNPVERNVYNNAKTLSVRVNKTGENGEALSGVVFGVFNDEDIYSSTGNILLAKDSLVLTLSTNNNGVAQDRTSVPEGHYYVKELKTIPGYILNTSTIGTIDFTTSNPEYNTTTYDVEFEFDAVNEATHVTVEKRDATSLELINGAELTVYDSDDNIVAVLTSGTTDFYAVPAGTYTIKETKTPNGFVTADDLTVTVQDVHTTQTFTMYDERMVGELTINKTVLGTAEPLAGVVYRIHDDTNNIPVGDYTTDADGKIVINELPVAIYNPTAIENIVYSVYEVSAPNGYVPDRVMRYFSFNVTDDTNTETFNVLTKTLDFENDYTKITISKCDYDDYITDDVLTLVEDATLALYDSDNNLIETWTESEHVIERIPIGIYTVREIETPNGFATAADLTISVTETGNMQYFNLFDEKLTGTITILKLAADNGEPMEGVCFNLFNATEQTPVSVNGEYNFYTDENGILTITNLPTAIYENGRAIENIEYELREVETNPGYVRVNDSDIEKIVFNVTDSSDTETYNVLNKSITLVNDYTKVVFNKFEKDTDEFVSGATFNVFSRDSMNQFVYDMADLMNYVETQYGDTSEMTDEEIGAFFEDIMNRMMAITPVPVETWTTDESSHEIDKLPVGNYVLVESETPAGYIPIVSNVEDPSDIFGYVDWEALFGEGASADILDGSLNLDGAYVFSVLETPDVQTFDLEEDFIKVEFSKIDATTGEPLAGVELALYAADDFAIDGFDGEIEPIATWITEDTPFTINKLAKGDYVVVETKALEGYVPMEPQYIEVKETADVQSFTFENDYTRVEILKIDAETEKPVSGAALALYHAEDVNEDGTIKEGAQPVAEWISTEKAQRFDKLPIGDYTLIELNAPDGYVLGKAATISVGETSDVQLFKYANEKLVITEITPEIPKTGDSVNHNVLLTITIIAAVLAISSIIAIVPKKKEEQE